MTDRTTNLFIETRPRSGRDAFRIEDNVTVAVGTLVQAEGSSGYLHHWQEDGNFVGIVIGGVDRAGDGIIIGETGDDILPEAYVDTSGAILMHIAVASSVQGSVGDLVYCADSDTANMTITDTTNPPVGFVVRWRSATDVDVQLFSMAEWAIGDASDASKWDA